MHWFVKGYIAHKKGENVNWAKVAGITIREKARREEVKMMKNGSLEFYGKGASDAYGRFEHKFCGSIVTETTYQFDKEPTIVSISCFGHKYVKNDKGA
jgi:hypothetical protein